MDKKVLWRHNIRRSKVARNFTKLKFIFKRWRNDNFPFKTVKISLSKLSKFLIQNCRNFRLQTVKISLSKLSKFLFQNCQNFHIQTVKISHSKLSKFPFLNCQNFPFQTVKISLSKLSKFPYSNCQNFSFKTVKISLSKLSKKIIFKLSKIFKFWGYEPLFFAIFWSNTIWFSDRIPGRNPLLSHRAKKLHSRKFSSPQQCCKIDVQ
jgi:hypothetical protein